jgi:hypothetical protein
LTLPRLIPIASTNKKLPDDLGILARDERLGVEIMLNMTTYEQKNLRSMPDITLLARNMKMSAQARPAVLLLPL